MSDAVSRNGTLVNGKPLRGEESVQLEPGDELQLGSVDMVFQDAGGMFDFLRGLI